MPSVTLQLQARMDDVPYMLCGQRELPAVPREGDTVEVPLVDPCEDQSLRLDLRVAQVRYTVFDQVVLRMRDIEIGPSCLTLLEEQGWAVESFYNDPHVLLGEDGG